MKKPMTNESLTNLSSIDGRYHDKLTTLRPLMSEYGLIRYRYQVEIEWLLILIDKLGKGFNISVSKDDIKKIKQLIENFNSEDAEAIKQIETTTNHDVKAVEYYIQHQLKKLKLKSLIPLVHFGCTSEDINNVSYALMLKDALHHELIPQIDGIKKSLIKKAKAYAEISMLSRTHGQSATPTTVGKEIANTVTRLTRQLNQLKNQSYLAKFNGAVGNHNAHLVAFPKTDWQKLTTQFLNKLNLETNSYTTQIEPHDFIAEIMHNLIRLNTILIDFARDTWSYISLGYYKQKSVKGEVGSSTMPHKVNPIDFENAEGNYGLANALASHLAEKLPISRWQRDLTDSTVMRNLGSVFGFIFLANHSLLKGINKLEANRELIKKDLNQHWEVLSEPIQTVLRKHGVEDAYEQLKDFARGQDNINKDHLASFIQRLSITEEAKQRLLTLTPENYLGYAVSLANDIDHN